MPQATGNSAGGHRTRKANRAHGIVTFEVMCVGIVTRTWYRGSRVPLNLGKKFVLLGVYVGGLVRKEENPLWVAPAPLTASLISIHSRPSALGHTVLLRIHSICRL